MDDQNFDDLARSFGGGASRRRVLRHLTGALAAGALGLLGMERADAACPPGEKRCGDRCLPACAPGKMRDPNTCACVCSASSCRNGCCDANGRCQPGTANDVCGNGGAACAACTGRGRTCGGGGTPRQCGCTPKSCTASDCGVVNDGCGGVINCPACANGQVCSARTCKACTAARAGDYCRGEAPVCGSTQSGFPCSCTFKLDGEVACVGQPGFGTGNACNADEDCVRAFGPGAFCVRGSNEPECQPTFCATACA